MVETKGLSEGAGGSEDSSVETGRGLRVVLTGPGEKDETDFGED